MSRATANAIHRTLVAILFAGIANLVECAKPTAMPMAKSSTFAEDDGIEAAADALAAMSLHAHELPDLPEHLEYLVLDTDDGPKVSVVPMQFAEMVQANPHLVSGPHEQNAEDSDVTLVQAPDTTGAKVNIQAVADLNRFNFHNNVLKDGHDQPLHWIVRFCHDWYEPCDQLTPVFTEAAFEIERMLNANDQFQTTVRFADVDCSTNKPLCNEVADYHFPQVIHFYKQARYADWKGGGNPKRNAENFLKWVDAQKAHIEHEVEFPDLLEAKTRKVPAIAPLQWDVRLVITIFIATAGALAAYFWILVRRITGMDLPGDRLKLSSTNLPQQRPVFTCRDMLPDEWRQPRLQSTAVLEL